jgi:uncharacterized protein
MVTVSRVPAAEIVALSKEKGFLAKQLYVVVTTPTNGMGPVMENIKEHLAFQESLEAQGIMFAAGVAAKDPMHSSGARKFTVRPWLVNEGTVTIKLNYAKGSFEVS